MKVKINVQVLDILAVQHIKTFIWQKLAYVNEILHLFCHDASQTMIHFQELAKSTEKFFYW
jgi:hypothetical protein